MGMKDKSNEWQNQAEDEMGEARERLGQEGRQRGQQQGQQQGRPGQQPPERGREGMRDMDDTAEQEMGERFDRDYDV